MSVENAKRNAKNNNLPNVEVYQSDLFLGLPEGRRYDIVYFNMPFLKCDQEQPDLDELGVAVVDPMRRLYRRFVKESAAARSERGRVFVTNLFSTEGKENEDLKELEQIANEEGFAYKKFTDVTKKVTLKYNGAEAIMGLIEIAPLDSK